VDQRGWFPPDTEGSEGQISRHPSMPCPAGGELFGAENALPRTDQPTRSYQPNKIVVSHEHGFRPLRCALLHEDVAGSVRPGALSLVPPPDR